VEFDPSFHTVEQDKNNSQWQIKAGFTSQREHPELITPKEATQGNNNRKRGVKNGPKKRASPNKRAK
jgi:hypothetical protein